ncbi:GCN5-related N-acetyltransferase [Exiguobacterium sp. 8H]|uniref:GNAT family N-acetyltransferase n=1 Tax=unclassified Exiguobacterium TaxID=2644629 RepID=UPI0012F074AF|nr:MULTISPECIES: GNAT family N-acetyltransferase [unclassified Exiguobacterium]VXA94575.1 GCN5-related N-acetyltransferase [Exiguobacterium sp. 8H]VXB91356.1 GCN5-related N-acetyltransferase [Exiguobacterium sp. 8A]
MEWMEWKNPDHFSDRVMTALLDEEAKNSLMIGVLNNVKQGIYETFHQFTVEEDGELLAILQVTPPHPLHYIVVKKERSDLLPSFIIPHLLKEEVPFSEVVSERQQAERFATAWQEITSGTSKMFMSQGLYRLDSVEDIDMATGRMREATVADQAQLEAWYSAFEAESGLRSSPPEKVTKAVQTMLEREEAVFWEVDGQVVSCAKRARPTENGITVSFVYTSPSARGKGYARSLVADLSRQLLETKSFCVLYTDLTNPTSNKIYREVGYQQIMDSAWVRFAR